ncbi:MAG: hypothetical protein IH793_10955, partial [Acidobacteria bacterium]|nr:hypothetical protein [Acidobacteriota bacterium]
AEEAGFEGILLADHVFAPESFSSKYPYDEGGKPPFDGSTLFPEVWSTISALAHERSGISEFHGMMRNLERLKALARTSMKNGRPAIEEPQIRKRIVRAETKIEAMRLNGMRFLTKQLNGEKLSSETSINKLHRALLEIEIGEIALEIQGSAAPLWQGAEPAAEDGHWQKFALSWPEVVIGGGTPNIQKNIIAERILGLPKD